MLVINKHTIKRGKMVAKIQPRLSISSKRELLDKIHATLSRISQIEPVDNSKLALEKDKQLVETAYIANLIRKDLK